MSGNTLIHKAIYDLFITPVIRSVALNERNTFDRDEPQKYTE